MTADDAKRPLDPQLHETGSDERAPDAETRNHDPRDAQESDPYAGMSDDPRVDPTPDHHQSDTAT